MSTAPPYLSLPPSPAPPFPLAQKCLSVFGCTSFSHDPTYTTQRAVAAPHTLPSPSLSRRRKPLILPTGSYRPAVGSGLFSITSRTLWACGRAPRVRVYCTPLRTRQGTREGIHQPSPSPTDSLPPYPPPPLPFPHITLVTPWSVSKDQSDAPTQVNSKSPGWRHKSIQSTRLTTRMWFFSAFNGYTACLQSPLIDRP